MIFNHGRDRLPDPLILPRRISGQCRRSMRVWMAVLFLLLPFPAIAQDYTVNLKETDIQELIKFVVDATGTTIVVDPSVKGKVKVVSSKPVSKDELYDLCLSILDVHG